MDEGVYLDRTTRRAILYFHWKTILPPARIAEYVDVHELVRLYEPNHSAEFWLRLQCGMGAEDL